MITLVMPVREDEPRRAERKLSLIVLPKTMYTMSECNLDVEGGILGQGCYIDLFFRLESIHQHLFPLMYCVVNP